MTDAYKKAGVDIAAGTASVQKIKSVVSETYNDAVLGGIGAFGGMLDLAPIIRAYKHPILVQSIDGVGTKLMVAQMVGKHQSIGEDIVNHCCNDILCQGAKPLSFLDYIAVEKLDPEQVAELVTGMAHACKACAMPLIGGEIAELPGIYHKDHYDLAGVITGVVEREKIIDGSTIQPGDQLVALPSSGLHTNGFSLARKLLFEDNDFTADQHLESLGETLGEALLKPHCNYAPAVLPLLDRMEVKGIAHITGGGLINNLPRIFPENCQAKIKLASWKLPPLFQLLSDLTDASQQELYTVFNMGVGLVLIVDQATVPALLDGLQATDYNPFLIGEMVAGTKGVQLY